VVFVVFRWNRIDLMKGILYVWSNEKRGQHKEDKSSQDKNWIAAKPKRKEAQKIESLELFVNETNPRLRLVWQIRHDRIG
jgi:hypothetical protein